MRGWTPKSAIARSRRNIDGAIERLRVVALEWQDVNQGFVDEAEGWIRGLEEFRDNIESETLEKIAAGEHVGL